MDLLAAARQVRLLAMDIDGTLTDGSIWIGPQGECAKRFSVRDGFGIKLLQKAGIELAIITGRRSEIVARRAEELGIRHVFQDVPDKLVVLKELGAQLGIGLQAAGGARRRRARGAGRRPLGGPVPGRQRCPARTGRFPAGQPWRARRSAGPLPPGPCPA